MGAAKTHSHSFTDNPSPSVSVSSISVKSPPDSVIRGGLTTHPPMPTEAMLYSAYSTTVLHKTVFSPTLLFLPLQPLAAVVSLLLIEPRDFRNSRIFHHISQPSCFYNKVRVCCGGSCRPPRPLARWPWGGAHWRGRQHRGGSQSREDYKL